jgi:hypothetical protein
MDFRAARFHNALWQTLTSWFVKRARNVDRQ